MPVERISSVVQRTKGQVFTLGRPAYSLRIPSFKNTNVCKH